MKIKYNGICDKGLKRESNQDRIYMKSNIETGLFVVADGMGGHLHGERASEHIVSEFGKWYESFDCTKYEDNFNQIIREIQRVLEQMNKTIYSFYGDREICGSTVVVLFIYKDIYAIFWVGDSRAYILNYWKCRLLTVDDVWENQTNIKASLNEKNIRENSNYGKLVNAIGVSQNARINIITDKINKRARFLLCSDGLYKMCSENEINKMIKRYNGFKGDIQMKQYLDAVYKHGAEDNVSYILVDYNYI
jgi:protein phosphatase